MNGEGRIAIVIDDEPNIKELVVAYLEEDNFDVYSASSGEEGLKLIRERNPAIIIIDIHMGKVNGMDVVKTIKEEKFETKIIVMSAKFIEGKTNFIKEAGKLGVDEVIAKPILDTILRLKIERALSH